MDSIQQPEHKSQLVTATDDWHPHYLDVLVQLGEAYTALVARDREIERLRASNEALLADPLIALQIGFWGSTICRYSEWEALADRLDAILPGTGVPPVSRPWRASLRSLERRQHAEPGPETQKRPWRDRRGHLHLPPVEVSV